MILSKLRKAATLCAGASIIAIIGTASAAAAQSGSAAPDDNAKDTGLGEIVVTAQKRSERLQDVPVTVTAVSPETLNRTAIDSTAGLSTLVPGLNLRESGIGFTPYLRGVGTAATSAGNENPISMYIDNIYLASTNVGLMDLASIDSIEVLKGPQGTLFGRNATGGVIHVKTRVPSHELGGNASVSFDNYETLIAKGYITGGITDTLAADLAVFYRNQNQGYGVNLATGNKVNYRNSITVRGKLYFTPTDIDSFTLAVDYSDLDGSGNAGIAYPGTTTNYGAPDATHPAPNGAPYQYTGSKWDSLGPVDPSQKVEAGGAALTYVHDFSWGSLSSFTAYRKNRLRSQWNGQPNPSGAQLITVNQPDEQFSQEFQLSALPDSKVQWILGAFYLDASARYDPFAVNVPLNPTQTRFITKQTIRSPALYGQVTVPVEALGDTNITGGLRYTIDRRSLVGRLDVALAANPAVVLATPISTDTSKTYKTFTWRLGVDHHFTPDVMAYASYNRGFKAGSYSTVPPTPTPSNPEYLDAYEVGLKSKSLDGRLIFNASAFLYEYKDLQVTIFNGLSALIENAASAEIMGLDVDITAQVTNGLRLSLGAELLDHKYKDYKNAPILRLLTLAQGGGVERTSGDASGKPLMTTSDAVINGAVYYDVSTNAGDLDFAVNFNWNSGYTIDPSAVLKTPSYFELNATAGWTFKNGTTRISIFGKNITDAEIPRVIPVTANPGGYVQVMYRPPATYGVELSQKF